DWTHEREWRWPYRGDIKKFLNHIKEYSIPENIESTPGFDFRSLSGLQIQACRPDKALTAIRRCKPSTLFPQEGTVFLAQEIIRK
ncbi:hypothetical protein MJM04_32135, partial [Salmonella enterica subsp. enterica serovar Cerro]|nr:hypothetical protein [Salmonella enterica subsp. enterica serovar Cerro]